MHVGGFCNVPSDRARVAVSSVCLCAKLMVSSYSSAVSSANIQTLTVESTFSTLLLAMNQIILFPNKKELLC